MSGTHSTPKSRRSTHHSHSTKPKPRTHSSPSSISIPEPPNKLFPSKPGEFIKLAIAAAIASSVALCCHVLFSLLNSHPMPFCDTTTDSPQYYHLSNSDNCEPCPSNGVCYQGQLECVHGYRRHGRLCVEDVEINDTVRKLTEWVESRLCTAYAQYLCDGTGTIWAQEGDIRHEIDKHELMESLGPDSVASAYTKQKALETIFRLFETRISSHGITELKCPDVLVDSYKPYTCIIHQWISEHAVAIVPVFALLVGFIWLILRVRRMLHLSNRVEELYHQVCDILEENALMSKSSGGQCEPWIIASWLRDHLLAPRERKNHTLWRKVEALIQEDSRVDRYPKIVKGESKVVWEWQVEGSLSSARIRKGEKENNMNSNRSVGMNSDQQQSLKAGGTILLNITLAAIHFTLIYTYICNHDTDRAYASIYLM